METTFTDWVIRALQIGPTNPEVGAQAGREILQFFREQVEQRRRGEREEDDLISFLLRAQIDGQPLDRQAHPRHAAC